MDLQLRGATVMVTGASGGIGDALLHVLIDEGCHVVALANRNVQTLRDRVCARGWGASVRCVQADVTDPAAMQAVFAGLTDDGVIVDSVIANAGVWPVPDEALHEASVQRIERTVRVNLLGSMWTVRAYMRTLTASTARSPSVVLIGSTAGRFGEAGHADYAAAKAGLVGMMLSVKNELTHLHPYARINVVEPGWTVTSMARPALQREGAIADATQTMALRQLARPVDIARTVVFLCSEASRHTSGQVVTVAGGMEGRRLWRRDQIEERAVVDRLAPDELG